MPPALLVSALLLGLAATPHCAAMCGAVGTAACTGSGQRGTWAFQAGRLLAYAGAGAVVALGGGALSEAARWSAALRPLWLLVQLGLFALGVVLLWQGRLPARLASWFPASGRSPGVSTTSLALAGAGGWQPVAFDRVGRTASAAGCATARQPAGWRAGLAGLAWVAWPCGVLQSALLLAALAGSAAGGATLMGIFALASAPGLLLAPWAWSWLRQRGLDDARATRLALRVAGLAMAGAAGWAMTHGLWQQVWAACGWG